MVNDKRLIIKPFINELIRGLSKNFIMTHGFDSILLELGVFKDNLRFN